LVRNGLPVDDPQARDLTVTAGRTAIPVMSVVQPGDAPLVLGIALDLGPESARDQSWIGRMVGSLADRGAARVRVLHRAGVDSGWGTAPAAVTDVLATLEPSNLGDLGKLVGAALDGFSGQGGRCWLLLVTDGRRAPDGGWKGVEQRAEAAGVPILVVGLWHGEFGSANRKHLRRLVTAAGGAVFYLQGPSQIEDLIERFGAVLDGSSVVRVAAPGGTGDVEVRFIAGDASVVSSTSVRTAPASSAR
jgi:hypothetical protein